MITKCIRVLAACCLVAMLGIGLCTDTVAAQEEKKTTNLDKDVGTKKGVAQSLGSKEIDEEKIPGKMEAGIAFGSCAVMIIVVKWL